MKNKWGISFCAGGFLKVILFFPLFFTIGYASAQQFNSDSWLSKPHGMMTIIPTWGERSSMLMNTVSLFPRWEFTIAAYLYNDDKDKGTDDVDRWGKNN